MDKCIAESVISLISTKEYDKCACKSSPLVTQKGAKETLKFCESLLLYVVKHQANSEDIVELLIKHGVNVNAKNKEGENALYCAIEKGSDQIVKLLLSNGADVNIAVKSSHETVKTPLSLATEKGCRQIVQLLLEFGANVNYEAKSEYSYKSPLLCAAENNHKEIFELLLEHGATAEIERSADTASKKGHCEIVASLLNYGFNVNASCSSKGSTMLHIAAYYESEKMKLIQLLLNKGADVNAKNNPCMTPLLYAACNQNKDIIDFLIDKGANIHDLPDSSESCLHFALKNDNDESVFEYFVDLGVSMEGVDECGDTVLLRAISNDDVKNVKLLLNRGANINHKNGSDESVFDCWEEENKNYKIAKLLVAHIVKIQSNNSFISEENLEAIKTDRVLNGICIQCEKEIEKMKSEVIPGSTMSVFDLLATKSVDKFEAFARNENMIKIVKSDSFKSNFPFYSATILDRFEYGILKNDLFMRFYSFFNFLYNRENEGQPLKKFPQSCVRQIFEYLSGEDVRKVPKIREVGTETK